MMKVKVCGMKDPDNAWEISRCNPDYMGFIFYQKSPRYIDMDTIKIITNNNLSTSKVGVFVNEDIDVVKNYSASYNLDYIQLHGNETQEYAEELSDENVKVIKALSIDEDFDWNVTAKYEEYVEFFIFDTATKNYGGSGKKFNWNLLSNYYGSKPYLLSGGITLNDAKEIKNLSYPLFMGIDINSGFETAPGYKDVDQVDAMIKIMRDE